VCRCLNCESGLPHKTMTASNLRMIAILNRCYPAPKPKRILASYGDPEPPAVAISAKAVRQPWEPRPARSRRA